MDAVISTLKQASQRFDDLLGGVIEDQDARGVVVNFTGVAIFMLIFLSGPFEWFGSRNKAEKEQADAAGAKKE